MSTKISVVIHTFNCENILRDCLERVKDFDEIVICDMYSDDKTLEIAKEYGCKIVMFERSGYAEPARNFAIQSASNDWVFVVDSDEWVKEPLKKQIRDFVENPGEYTGARIVRRARDINDKTVYSDDTKLDIPEYLIRVFRKDDVDWPPEVHSSPIIKSGKIYDFPYTGEGVVLDHVMDFSWHDYIDKLNKYTDFEVEKLVRKGKKVNIYYTYFQSIWRTLEMFFFEGGYKQGIDGFIWCAVAGFYKFLSRAKYLEYLKKQKQKMN